jgi:cytochrome c oxidase subunit III
MARTGDGPMTATPAIDLSPPPRRKPAPPPPGGPGDSGRGPGDGGSGGGKFGQPPAGADPAQMAATAMWVALAPILMLFMAFLSAYVVRRGLGQGFGPVLVPSLLWGNTAILLLSSAVLEGARRKAAAGGRPAPWLWATFALGALFVSGQLLAWRQLAADGVAIGTTPYSAFFYLLTGAHAVHLAGGLLGLGAVALWPTSGVGRIPRPAAIRVAAIYWHFMGVLWLVLFSLLIGWR